MGGGEHPQLLVSIGAVGWADPGVRCEEMPQGKRKGEGRAGGSAGLCRPEQGRRKK